MRVSHHENRARTDRNCLQDNLVGVHHFRGSSNKCNVARQCHFGTPLHFPRLAVPFWHLSDGQLESDGRDGPRSRLPCHWVDGSIYLPQFLVLM